MCYNDPMTIANFPFVFALIVFAIGFGYAYLVSLSDAINPTLGDVLKAMMWSSGPVGALVVWCVWYLNAH